MKLKITKNGYNTRKTWAADQPRWGPRKINHSSEMTTETSLFDHPDLERVEKRMRDYNRDCAPGSECAAWQDYVQDRHELAQRNVSIVDFVDYWADVANGMSDDYDPKTGSKTE